MDASTDATLQRLRDRIADYCVDIEDLFIGPVLVGVIVRWPGNDDRDVLVTNAPIAELEGVLSRSKTRTELPR